MEMDSVVGQEQEWRSNRRCEEGQRYRARTRQASLAAASANATKKLRVNTELRESKGVHSATAHMVGRTSEIKNTFIEIAVMIYFAVVALICWSE